VQRLRCLLRPGNGEHARVVRDYLLGLRAHATGDEHLAVLGQRLADSIERLRLSAVEKAAGVDDDKVGAVMLARDLIAFGAQARDDALGIHKGLRASKADETDARGRHETTSGFFGIGGPVPHLLWHWYGQRLRRTRPQLQAGARAVAEVM